MSATASSLLSAAQAGSREALGQVLYDCRTYLLQVARQSLSPALQAKGDLPDDVAERLRTALEDFGRSFQPSAGEAAAEGAAG